MFGGVLGVVLLVTVPRPVSAGTAAAPGDCWWTVKTDADTANIAFPDEGARYYSGQFTALPATGFAIRGTFPKARYISFHLYEGSVPVAGIPDVLILPATGINPFIAGADRTETGTYEIRVVPGPAPAKPDPNTLYAQGLNGEPLMNGVIIYRIYLPEDDEEGGVPLPSVSFEVEDGPGESLSTSASCEALRDLPTVSDVAKSQSLPTSSIAAPTIGTWGRATSRPSSVASVGGHEVRSGNTFFANFDNEYLKLMSTREAGDVVVFRAKAPTFADTRTATTMPTAQLRYFSICTNDLPTTRYVACVADEDTVVAGDGTMTFVVSDVAHKPSTLEPTDNWLPNGPYPDFFILYRHMLPAADFAGAIQNVPDGSNATDAEIRASMGDYYPVAKICSTAEFETSRCGM